MALDDIPEEMRALRRWMAWWWDGKDKRPLAGWGREVTPLTFGETLKYKHRGFILGQDEHGRRWGGVDLDACLGLDGRLAPWAEEAVERFQTYAEISPSGVGIKMVSYGAPEYLSICVQAQEGPTLCEKRPALEAYVGGRWFAVTGKRWGNHPVRCATDAWDWLAAKLNASTVRPQGVPPLVVIEPEVLEAMLARVDVEKYRDQRDWFLLMCSCHHATNGLGREEWIAWSISDGAYSDQAEIIGRRWDSLDASKAGGIGWGPLARALRKAGAADMIPQEVLDAWAKQRAEQARRLYDNWRRPGVFRNV